MKVKRNYPEAFELGRLTEDIPPMISILTHRISFKQIYQEVLVREVLSTLSFGFTLVNFLNKDDFLNPIYNKILKLSFSLQKILIALKVST